ncbi:MAG TPA: sensor histidine kinase [Thiotrichales bacterium]|nr:sensor histidine kinase [Thiotrichales bacterium]
MEEKERSPRHDEPLSYLPEFCDIRILFGVVLLAELLALVLMLAAHRPGHGWDQLGLVSLFVQWVALGSAGLLCVLRPALQRLPPVRAGLASYGVVIGVSAAVAGATLALAGPMGLHHLAESPLWFFGRTLAISAIVGAAVLRIFYLQHLQRIHLEAESAARIEALQARIRPHFLFNSMNTIAALIQVAPEKAEQAVENLADLFRTSLDSGRRGVPLATEIECARRYLEIEALRLGERLAVEWAVEAPPEEALVPPLILQPLLENAIYHGIENLEQGGTIRVGGQRRGHRYCLVIDNPLPEQTRERRHQGRRLAFENIAERLQIAFGGGGTLEMRKEAGHCTVTLCFPAGGMER